MGRGKNKGICNPGIIIEEEIIPFDNVESLYPHTTVWEITLQCNMSCIHCGSTAGAETKRCDELTTEEAVDVIRQIREINGKRIIFSGGEPLIRKDWPALARAVADNGMTGAYVSNGFIIDDKVAKMIRDNSSPDTHIGMSFDGNEETHDYIRQTKGAHKHVLRAIKALQEQRIPVGIITTVSKLNIDQLDEIRDTIFQYPGVYVWQLQVATPFGRLKEHRDIVISNEEYDYLYNYIVTQKQIWGDRIAGVDGIGYYTDCEPILRKSEWKGCYAGISVLGLTSNGGVMGCLSLQDLDYLEGNVRERPLKEIWYDPNAFAYNRKFKQSDLQGFCKTCKHSLKCRGGCKNTALASTGSLFENEYCIYRIQEEKQQKQHRKSA